MKSLSGVFIVASCYVRFLDVFAIVVKPDVNDQDAALTLLYCNLLELM